MRLIVVLMLFLSGLAAASPSNTLEEIKTRKELQVGLDTGFIPFAMHKPNGEWVGFDIDIAEGFAKSLGVKLKIVEIKWDMMFAALQAKRFDMIVHGVTITDERKKTLLFSDPYYDAGQYTLISKKMESVIKNTKQLDDPKYTVAVQTGTTGDIWVSKNLKKANVLRFDSEHDAAQAVKLGKIAGFIYDKPYLTFFAKRNPDQIVLLPETLTAESLGVVVRKSDTPLVEAFNSFLKTWRKSGGYDNSLKVNFVEMPWLKDFPELNK